uniref:Uncharacterized protein n=1 Tax=Arundo donax TaxID=35708 RepID=A0A0A9AC90_ARUDO
MYSANNLSQLMEHTWVAKEKFTLQGPR